MPIILAVADGHGNAVSFRSDVGARLAVQAALTALLGLVHGPAEVTENGDAVPSPTALKRILEEALPRSVVKSWDTVVAAELAEHPFEPDEIQALSAARGVAAIESVTVRPARAYGSTVLAVLVADGFVIYFQLGDGDILTVADDGTVGRPVPPDPRLFANETTSLGADRAWEDVRVVFQTIEGAPPALILVATDGYSNAFRSDADFCQIGPDLLALLRHDGIEYVSALLPEWLAEVSREGSGDDVTLGLIVRTDALVDPTGTEIDACGTEVGPSDGGPRATASTKAADTSAQVRSTP